LRKRVATGTAAFAASAATASALRATLLDAVLRKGHLQCFANLHCFVS